MRITAQYRISNKELDLSLSLPYEEFEQRLKREMAIKFADEVLKHPGLMTKREDKEEVFDDLFTTYELNAIILSRDTCLGLIKMLQDHYLPTSALEAFKSTLIEVL